MNDVVISARGLGKAYALGGAHEKERYHALRDVIAGAARGAVRRLARLRAQASAVSAATQAAAAAAAPPPEPFWALREADFDIRRGEVVGIIGRNGAGKSTLLKILSRITEPSAGRVEIRGRVASLLEVGTGFHPELTGRENVFLNGAILGMTQREIRARFDEIVAFAEVERFLDTPVKRYSSGMYTRLAFAVAAHLEPEILVVDEVLAVGDAQFQKKCLGKMQDVATGGRTVLFVSHNMAAVQSLCARGLVLQGGRLMRDADARTAVDEYLQSAGAQTRLSLEAIKRSGAGVTRFRDIRFLDETGETIAGPICGSTMRLLFCFEGDGFDASTSRIGLSFHTRSGTPLFLCASETYGLGGRVPANGSVECVIPRFPLVSGDYSITLFLEVDGVIQDWTKEPLHIDVAGVEFYPTGRSLPSGWEGTVTLVRNDWRIIESKQL